jgi:hypothetical protein
MGWHGLIDSGPTGDLDADLRVALLALWVGGDRPSATEFLSRSADRKIEYLNSIEQNNELTAVAPLAGWYSSMRSTAAKTLLDAESIAIRTVAKSLPRNIPVKSKRASRRATKPTRA